VGKEIFKYVKVGRPILRRLEDAENDLLELKMNRWIKITDMVGMFS
jgi:hypothetical protein